MNEKEGKKHVDFWRRYVNTGYITQTHKDLNTNLLMKAVTCTDFLIGGGKYKGTLARVLAPRRAL